MVPTRVAVTVFASLVLCRAVSAQAPVPQEACADTASAGSYQRCALWLEPMAKVHRGQYGEVVLKKGFFSPLALSRVVRGDSAQEYAHRYSRNMKIAGGLFVGSSALVAAAAIVGASDNCDAFIFGTCGNRANLSSTGLLFGGLALGIVGSYVVQNSGKDAQQAIWWHNARFAK